MEGAKSVAEVKRLLAERVRKTPKGEWVMGRGWNENVLKERRFLTRWDIDDVSPDNPVYLHHYSCHATLLNSKGLEVSRHRQERRRSPPGAGSSKTRGASRRASSAQTPASWDPSGSNGVRPRPDLATLREAILIGVNEAVKYGLTAIHVPSADHDEIKVTQELAAEGKLPLRVNLLPKVELLDSVLKLGINSGLGDEMLRTRSHQDIQRRLPHREDRRREGALRGRAREQGAFSTIARCSTSRSCRRTARVCR